MRHYDSRDGEIALLCAAIGILVPWIIVIWPI